MNDEIKKRIQNNAKDKLITSIANCLKAGLTPSDIQNIFDRVVDCFNLNKGEN